MKWIFDGIGTEIVSLIIGIFSGGLVGYRMGVSSKGKQKQKAKSYARQKQNMNIKGSMENNGNNGIKSNYKQIQKAGDGAFQSQIGRINNER